MVNATVPAGMRKLGWKNAEIKEMCRVLSRIALMSSWLIYRHRECRYMDMYTPVLAEVRPQSNAGDTGMCDVGEIAQADLDIMTASTEMLLSDEARALQERFLETEMERMFKEEIQPEPEPETPLRLVSARVNAGWSAATPQTTSPLEQGDDNDIVRVRNMATALAHAASEDEDLVTETEFVETAAPEPAPSKIPTPAKQRGRPRRLIKKPGRYDS